MTMDMDDIEGMITFTYYHDLTAAERFYGEIMGLEKVIDVDFAKVTVLRRTPTWASWTAPMATPRHQRISL